MTPEKIAALLSTTHVAIVGVNRVDGGPQLTPVRFFWDGETFYFSTTTDRAKFANIKRNASITLIVEDPEGYIAAYGKAEIMETGFTDLVRPIIEKYMPDRIEAGMAIVTQPNRVLILLRPERLLGNEDALQFAQATGSRHD
jgi:PPOX class probable F420-dependent enzyme